MISAKLMGQKDISGEGYCRLGGQERSVEGDKTQAEN